MSRAWPRAANWKSQVRHLHGALHTWNRVVFGNIFERKRRLMRHLEGVAHRLTTNPSLDLERAQKRIWGEYEQVLSQEELLWFQKSRSKWLMFGDRNSRYFHGITTVRRRKNVSDLLQDLDGNWVGDQENLERLVTNYFKDLFTDKASVESACISSAFLRLSDVEVNSFQREVTKSDIFNVINRMGPFKAPRPDGL